MVIEMSKTRRRSERLNASKTNLLSESTQSSCKRLRSQTRERTVSGQLATGICRQVEDYGKQPPTKRCKKQQKPVCKVSSKCPRIHLTKRKKGKQKAAKPGAKSNAVKLDSVPFPFPDNQPNIVMEEPLTPFTNNDDDDDDDDALPRFDFIPDEKFKEGDLIWVKHGRDPHWPAVALKLIYQRKILHKVHVGFVEYDESKKLKHKPMSLKYSSDRMQPISKDYDARKNGHMKDSVSKRFKKAIDEVERFLFSSNRSKLKAKDYFGMTEECLVKTEREDRDGVENNLDTAASPLSVKSNDGSVDTNLLGAGIKGEVKTEEDEGEKEVIEVKDDVFFNDARPKYSEDTYRRIKERQRKEKELVDLIRNSDELKAHLESVLCGSKNSTYHSAFHKPGKSRDENRALKTLGFGPIENELYISELTRFLQNHLCKLKDRPKERDDIYYLTDVWLPEAIIFGIRLQMDISLEEAEQIFGRGIEYTPEEVADFVDDMIANTTDEDRAEQRARTKRSLTNKAPGVVQSDQVL